MSAQIWSENNNMWKKISNPVQIKKNWLLGELLWGLFRALLSYYFENEFENYFLCLQSVRGNWTFRASLHSRIFELSFMLCGGPIPCSCFPIATKICSIPTGSNFWWIYFVLLYTSLYCRRYQICIIKEKLEWLSGHRCCRVDLWHPCTGIGRPDSSTSIVSLGPLPWCVLVHQGSSENDAIAVVLPVTLSNRVL